MPCTSSYLAIREFWAAQADKTVAPEPIGSAAVNAFKVETIVGDSAHLKNRHYIINSAAFQDVPALRFKSANTIRTVPDTPMVGGFNSVHQCPAKAIEAGTGETRSGSMPKARKRGGEAIRPYPFSIPL